MRPTGGQYGGQAMVHVQTGDSQLYHVIGMSDVRDHGNVSKVQTCVRCTRRGITSADMCEMHQKSFQVSV